MTKVTKVTETYEYDTAGNLTKKTVTTESREYSDYATIQPQWVTSPSITTTPVNTDINTDATAGAWGRMSCDTYTVPPEAQDAITAHIAKMKNAKEKHRD